MTFSLRHLFAALVLHGLLVVLLAGGLQCTKKPTRPPVIHAVLLDPDRKTAQAQQQQKKRVEEQKRADQKRKLEEQVRQKEKEDQQRKLAERQREEAVRKQQAAADAQKKKADDARKQKELADKKKAEDLARKKQEQEEARERQSEAQRELQDKALMEQQMRQEELDREVARAAATQAASEREKKQAVWADALSRHVQRYWNRPAGATGDFECSVQVQLLPDGTVTKARIDSSCGSPALDRSVEDAVFRASPLPRPADPDVFDRDLNIRFTP
ncbi:MAG TPA: cell envelope integrity protein TolA [Verrucomicrobiae bacterium]|nr:cell envelope integrity protein TolA [Verrucomicrobiae bacterium]